LNWQATIWWTVTTRHMLVVLHSFPPSNFFVPDRLKSSEKI